MDRLPPSVLVAIGRHLEDGDRNACVLASRDLWPVHESSTRHTLTYYPREGERLHHVRATVAHVLALKPRMRALNVRLYSFGVGFVSLFDGLAGAAAGAGANVHISFDNCDPDFVRAVAALGTSVSINANSSDKATAGQVDGLLRSLAPKVASVGCSNTLFAQIPPDAFDDVARISLVAVAGRASVIDLRGLRRAVVELYGDAMWFTVYGACKLASVSDAHRPTPNPRHEVASPLLESLRREDAPCVRRVEVTDAANAAWCDLIALLPATAEYTVTVTTPMGMRLLERLGERGVTSIRLSATSRDAYVIARMTCLLLQKRYAIVATVPVDDAGLTVRDLFERLHPAHQEAWFAVKFLGLSVCV